MYDPGKDTFQDSEFEQPTNGVADFGDIEDTKGGIGPNPDGASGFMFWASF